jgi:hypothetical protein
MSAPKAVGVSGGFGEEGAWTGAGSIVAWPSTKPAWVSKVVTDANKIALMGLPFTRQARGPQRVLGDWVDRAGKAPRTGPEMKLEPGELIGIRFGKLYAACLI